MIYRALADLVLVLHLAFIAFVVVGGLVTLVWRWAPLVHLPAALWGAFIEVSGGICPLTPLENTLRRAAGSSGYAGGFVEHYLVPVIYPAGLTHSLQLVLGAAVVLSNVLVYAFVWRRLKGSRSSVAICLVVSAFGCASPERPDVVTGQLLWGEHPTRVIECGSNETYAIGIMADTQFQHFAMRADELAASSSSPILIVVRGEIRPPSTSSRVDASGEIHHPVIEALRHGTCE